MEQYERRIRLSDEQMDQIAEKAAAKALAKVYEEVGKSVAKRFLLFLGALAIGLVTLLAKADIKLHW